VKKFRLEVSANGQPRAVFEEEEATSALLLSGFLHPSLLFVPDMLHEISLVERRALRTSGFESEAVRALFHGNMVEVESAEHLIKRDVTRKVVLSLDEAKLLLFEWGAALLRWHMEQNVEAKGSVELRYKQIELNGEANI
jgi:hypothetical protein